MNSAASKAPPENALNERLAHSGLRVTPQRQKVHEVLMDKMDHPDRKCTRLNSSH